VKPMPTATLPPLQWFCGGRDRVGKIPGGWTRVAEKTGGWARAKKQKPSRLVQCGKILLESGPERKNKQTKTGGWARVKNKKSGCWARVEKQTTTTTKTTKTGGWTRAKNQTKTHHAGPERKKQQQEAGPKQNQSVPHTPSSRAILLQDGQ